MITAVGGGGKVAVGRITVAERSNAFPETLWINKTHFEIVEQAVLTQLRIQFCKVRNTEFLKR